MTRTIACLVLLSLAACAWAAPLQTFEVKDYLGHTWADELIHFDFSATTSAKDLTLADAAGKALPCQFTDLQRAGGKVSGKVWTVVTLPPDGSASFQLLAAKPPALAGVQVGTGPEGIALKNDRMIVYLPQYPGVFKEPTALTSLPAPLRSVGLLQGEPLGLMRWFDQGEALGVKEASTTLLEKGPVRVVVKQSIVLVDGRKYSMTISLAARQDAALIAEDSDIEAPKAGLRYSLLPGLGANHIFWNNQWKETEHAKSFAQTDTAVDFTKEDTILQVPAVELLVVRRCDRVGRGSTGRARGRGWGIMALRPSRWSPWDWGRVRPHRDPGADRAGAADGRVLRAAGLEADARREGELPAAAPRVGDQRGDDHRQPAPGQDRDAAPARADDQVQRVSAGRGQGLPLRLQAGESRPRASLPLLHPGGRGPGPAAGEGDPQPPRR